MRFVGVIVVVLLILPAAGCGDAPAPTPPEPGPLAKKLTEKREAGKKRLPEEVATLFQKATKDLAESGIAESAKNVGADAPVFSLKDSLGSEVSLSKLLAKGPVVVAFYRGKW